MPTDRRYYVRFTVDFPEHEKILPLSDAAFRCFVEATIWSCKRKTDGWLASRLALAKWSLDVLTELSTNDDRNPTLIASEEGWQIRDYAEHQQTKAEIEAQAERNRIAGQKGGLAKAKRSAKRGAKRNASQVLSENVAEVEVEVETSSTHLSSYPDLSNAAVSATPGADLVREIIPAGHPGAVTTMLRLRAAEMINNGTDRTDVAAALRLWLTKPNLGPGALPSLVSEVIKTRTGGPGLNGRPEVSAFDRKRAHNAAVFEALGHPTRSEIEP